VRTVTYDGNADKDLLIVSTSKPNVKKITSAPDDDFEIGKYIVFNGFNWLINSTDKDTDFLTVGEMTLCPVSFVFQSSTTRVYSYPYFVISSTSLIDEGQNIMTPDGVRKISIPFDEVTEDLYRDKRLMGVDFNGIPQCWRIIDLDSDTTKGILIATLKSDGYNSESDNINQRICDYVEPTAYTTTPPTLGRRVEIEYRGSATLKIGGSKKLFTAVYYDANGEVDTPIVTDWSISVAQDISGDILSEVITNSDTTKSYKLNAINDSALNGELVSVTATEHGASTPRTTTILVEVVNAL
jgi:hypothetical protein